MNPRPIALALAFVAIAGCRSDEPDTVVVREPAQQPSTIVIEKEHVHGAGCGHYYYNGRWYAEPEHIHVID
jgi:hypothetical protein